MKRFLPWIALLALASVPMWLRDPYLLNAFVTTGIFIVAAMSLNLLLGYTGQLSLGHAAFFGIGAYASALVSLGFEIEILGYPIVVQQRVIHVEEKDNARRRHRELFSVSDALRREIEIFFRSHPRAMTQWVMCECVQSCQLNNPR